MTTPSFSYSVRAFCPICNETHALNWRHVANEEFDTTQSVGNLYDGRDVPEEIGKLSNASWECGTNGDSYKIRGNHDLFLVRHDEAAMGTEAVRCMACGGPVTVRYEPEEVRRDETYFCPHCKALNRLSLSGRIIWAIPN